MTINEETKSLRYIANLASASMLAIAHALGNVNEVNRTEVYTELGKDVTRVRESLAVFNKLLSDYVAYVQ